MILDDFYNYHRERWYWFLIYLQLGEAISADKTLSAAHSDFGNFYNDWIVTHGLKLETEKKKRRGSRKEATL